MFKFGDRVLVNRSSLLTYGEEGVVSGFYNDKIKVQFNRNTIRELGLQYSTLIFSPSSLRLIESSQETKPEVVPTMNQELILAKIAQHQIHCNQHPNDLESKQHLENLKKQLGNDSLKDIKKSLEPKHEIFCALYRTSKRFNGYEHLGCSTASSKEHAQEKLESLMLHDIKNSSEDYQYHAIIRALPTPVELEYKMIKMEKQNEG